MPGPNWGLQLSVARAKHLHDLDMCRPTVGHAGDDVGDLHRRARGGVGDHMSASRCAGWRAAGATASSQRRNESNYQRQGDQPDCWDHGRVMRKLSCWRGTTFSVDRAHDDSTASAAADFIPRRGRTSLANRAIEVRWRSGGQVPENEGRKLMRLTPCPSRNSAI